MSDNKEAKDAKKSPLNTFKELLRKGDASQALTDGIKSTNAKVRSYAIKIALRTQDNTFYKKTIAPLIASDKSPRVLKTIASKITRKSLLQKLETLKKQKPAAKKEVVEGAETPKA